MCGVCVCVLKQYSLSVIHLICIMNYFVFRSQDKKITLAASIKTSSNDNLKTGLQFIQYNIASSSNEKTFLTAPVYYSTGDSGIYDDLGTANDPASTVYYSIGASETYDTVETKPKIMPHYDLGIEQPFGFVLDTSSQSPVYAIAGSALHGITGSIPFYDLGTEQGRSNTSDVVLQSDDTMHGEGVVSAIYDNIINTEQISSPPQAVYSFKVPPAPIYEQAAADYAVIAESSQYSTVYAIPDNTAAAKYAPYEIIPPEKTAPMFINDQAYAAVNNVNVYDGLNCIPHNECRIPMNNLLVDGNFESTF